jgi:hypothetical protein
VYLAPAQTLVLAASGGPGDPVIAAFDNDGALIETFPWASSARVLAVGPSGNAAIAVASSTDQSGSSSLGLMRFVPGVGVTNAPVVLRPSATQQPVSVLGDRAGTLVLLDDGRRRESLLRLSSDGTVTLLAVRNGHGGTVVPASDGYLLAGLQVDDTAARGIDLVALNCPRPPPAAPPTATASATSSATNVAPVSDGSISGDAASARP